MQQGPVVLFDGVCNFCNRAVNFILRHEKKAVLKFAPLQSEAGRRLARQYGLNSDQPESLVLIEEEKLYLRSSAALRICRYLRGGWPLMIGFIIVPTVIRDLVYRWIAANRYRWFGRRSQCMVPTEENRSRFINE